MEPISHPKHSCQGLGHVIFLVLWVFPVNNKSTHGEHGSGCWVYIKLQAYLEKMRWENGSPRKGIFDGRETKAHRDLRAVSRMAGAGKQQVLNQEGSTWR